MPLTLYPEKGEGYGNPIPIIDAFRLYDECKANGLLTDWWYPQANTITMIAGENPSEAYLLIQKKYIEGVSAANNNGVEIEPLSRIRYNHKIVLDDSVRQQRQDDPLSITGWIYNSASAVDPSHDPDDLETVYLVKFVDVRWLYAQQTSVAFVSGALLGVYDTGFNVISLTRDDDDMAYDPAIKDDFPFISSTVPSGGAQSWGWEDLLSYLWNHDTFVEEEGATMPWKPDLLPTGGDYPESHPLDVLPENTPTWKLFCQLLHASGNEIYPWFDGTFRILPIDDHTGETSELDDYAPYLIDARHADSEDRIIPSYMCLKMRFRSRTEGDEEPQANAYITFGPYRTTSGVNAMGAGDPILESDEDDGAVIVTGENPVGDGNLIGTIETVTTMAQGYVDPGFSPTDLLYSIEQYARFALRKLLRSRLDNEVDSTYGYFIGLSPSPEFEKVTYFISENGPATRFQSLSSSIGVESVPLRSGGGGGVIEDRLVASDTTDETPATLHEKVYDHDTYDPMLHTLVWAEVVDDPSDTKDNHVRFFTTIGAGEPGPTGPQGEPGTPGPTYSAGCGIIIAGTTIHLFPDEVAGPGLQVDPFATTTCSLAVDPDDLAGCGLAVAADNEANDAVKLKVNPADLAGCGLLAASDNTDNAAGPCKLKVNPIDLAGCGLKAATDNQTDGDGPCKLVIDITAIKNPDEGIDAATGNQEDGNGPCKLKIKTNTTIKVPTSIELFQETGVLKVRLNYTEYEVYAIAGATGSMSDDEATTDCGEE